MEHPSQPAEGGQRQDSVTDDAGTPEGTSVPAIPERLWRSIAVSRQASTSTTSAALRDLLCATEGILPDEADRRLEAHAINTGLIRVGETWYAQMPTFELPSMPRASYDRIVRALHAHIRDCDSDRARHGAVGNHGAARALASEVAATMSTLAFIEAHTRTMA